MSSVKARIRSNVFETNEHKKGFDTILRTRIRHQKHLDELRMEQRGKLDLQAKKDAIDKRNKHVVGQAGCFCMDCLQHHHQDWRIGDVNTMLTGPRDQWRQFTWGNAERFSLYDKSEKAMRTPNQTLEIRETIILHDSRRRPLPIEREAKFIQVASGKYHTLMLTESGSVFSSGDNTYGSLGFQPKKNKVEQDSYESIPRRVVENISSITNGKVELITTSDYASFALVALPIADGRQKSTSEEFTNENSKSTVSTVGAALKAAGTNAAINAARLLTGASSVLDDKERDICNYLFSWGRGERGVLGHGDTVSSHVPRILHTFDRMKVIEVSAGRHHVLVLTDMDGVFAFGQGSNGQLGLGDAEDHYTPAKITSLDGLNVIQVSAGGDHSIAVTGETHSNRQIFSWGLGKNGRLGHNDEKNRLTPTRMNFFRGKKVTKVSCGGGHNLATSEAIDGTVMIWSWGEGTYGQLGHRDTWDTLLPRSIDEIRREKVRHISAGERHSLAITDSNELWVWGQGVHGEYEIKNPDVSSTSLLAPVKVPLKDIHIISAVAGKGRTFVWGDRAVERKKIRALGNSLKTDNCCALPEYQTFTSNSFRIIYRCGPCNMDNICISCAHKCHLGHALQLDWTFDNASSKECDCFNSQRCFFDLEQDGDEEILLENQAQRELTNS